MTIKSPTPLSDTDRPSFVSFRHTINNPVLIEAINEHKLSTGKSNDQIIRDSLIHYLEENELIQLQ